MVRIVYIDIVSDKFNYCDINVFKNEVLSE